MTNYLLMNGQLVPREQVTVNPYDLGLIRGYGVFDFLRTYGGRPYALDRHADRLLSSAAQIGIEHPWSREQIIGWARELLARNVPHANDAGIRLVLTGGPTDDGFSPGGRPTLLGMVEPLPVYPDEHTARGITLLPFEHLRDIATAKTTNYVRAISLMPEWRRRGAMDALYTCQGNVLEATRSNFFAFIGDTLVTPRENVLLGTTRRTVLTIARDRFKVEERTLTLEELKDATELFITGTTRKITPVIGLIGVNLFRVHSDAPGKNTLSLMKRFAEYVANNETV